MNFAEVRHAGETYSFENPRPGLFSLVLVRKDEETIKTVLDCLKGSYDSLGFQKRDRLEFDAGMGEFLSIRGVDFGETIECRVETQPGEKPGPAVMKRIAAVKKAIHELL